jgi:indolepyruvate ferredoxin oxidoreductase alpha subunit
VARFVVDCQTLIRIASGELEVASQHRLLAPTLVRSQALAALYAAAQRGKLSTIEGLERVWRLNALGVRFLGDRVLQQRAWQVADQLGWETTADAEVVALALLQADALVTADAELARAASALVAVVAPEALRVPDAG